ncbi:Replication factor C, subunit RFC4 [Entomophthora muscae]|uniref:Replication factor C, subunit RFC4 n=1 Tax=Entomophthora muscae TaxID=34485 RepID=A0ACC2RHR6_9FUNG|nr:Replication factor C, subunit RFC4 [Entomophthora muscae]
MHWLRMTGRSLQPLLAKTKKNEIRAQLSPLLRAKNYVSEYRYYIVAGSWVGGMSLAGLYLYRKKYMTPTQKLVEARMYAQAITLGSLAAVAAFSSGATTDPKSEK